jgi:LPPG:FO 2-phospho-L-lactate transferase
VSVVLLSGGSGGAKLARGLYELLGAELTVVANTGDDTSFYGAHVSPDADRIAYWLAGRADKRGWGIKGDSSAAIGMLRELGVEVWFNIGDRDLAWCLERRRLLDAGLNPTEAQARLLGSLGVDARLLPMSDQPARTRIRTPSGWLELQEWIVRERSEPPIEDVDLSAARAAAPSPAVLDALAAAEAIVVGPSNPIISIGPILALRGMREALAAAPAPVVAVSPIVGGRALTSATAACLEWAGREVSSAGVVACYEGLLDGIVSDEPAGELTTLRCQTLMSNAAQRRMLAQRALELAQSIGGPR